MACFAALTRQENIMVICIFTIKPGVSLSLIEVNEAKFEVL